MTFLEKIEIIDRVDGLIRRKATGSAKELASRLGVSRRCVFDILNTMKAMDAKIDYCNKRKSYYYAEPCDLVIGFQPKNEIKGGKSYFLDNIYTSADFLHSHEISLLQNQI